MLSRVEKEGVVLKEEVKMKGISFNAEAAQTVSCEAMEGLVNDQYKKLSARQYLIRKDLFKTKLWSTTMMKKVQFQSKKRWFKTGDNPTMDTLPYGYC